MNNSTPSSHVIGDAPVPASLYWSRAACTRLVAVLCGLPLIGMGVGALSTGTAVSDGIAAAGTFAGLIAGLLAAWLMMRVPGLALRSEDLQVHLQLLSAANACEVQETTFQSSLRTAEFAPDRTFAGRTVTGNGSIDPIHSLHPIPTTLSGQRP